MSVSEMNELMDTDDVNDNNMLSDLGGSDDFGDFGMRSNSHLAEDVPGSYFDM